MHSIKSLMKRFSTIFLALAMAIGCSVSAFAAEPTDVTIPQLTSVSDEASTRSLGNIIAGGSTTISGGSGTLNVYLPNGNFWADIVVTLGYAQQNGAIKCSVTTPNGTFIDLGTVSTNSPKTNSYELFYADAGTYTFYFYSAMTTSFNIAAYLYD